MSVRRAFDYLMVQVVPRVDRDERRNVGVILFCPTAAFLGCRFSNSDDRLRLFAPELDLVAVNRQLDAIQAVCVGDPAAGPVARLPISQRFHWLSAPRSTVVQPSAAHVGLCRDPATALDTLFASVFSESMEIPSPTKAV